MTHYVGIDFGGAMIKAAATASVEAAPQIVRLNDRDPFVPSAVRCDASGGVCVGWDAFVGRRSLGLETATGFRDRTATSDGQVSLSGQAFDGVSLAAHLLTPLGGRMQQQVPEAVAASVAIPDDWDASFWTLPLAVARAGWSPQSYVREWCAVLSVTDVELPERVLMLSAGGTGLRGTLCERRSGVWKATKSTKEPAVSGVELRNRIAEQLAEDVIKSIRLDPREDPHSDQSLHDGIDAALIELCRRPDALLQTSIAGKEYKHQLSRAKLTDWLVGWRLQVQTLAISLWSGRDECPVVCWGELSILLPIAEWLRDASGGFGPVHAAPLDAVAAGTARLCAYAAGDGFDRQSPNLAGLDPQTGHYNKRLSGSATPLQQHLPSNLSPTAVNATLVLLDENRTVRIENTPFKLGRDPENDLAFNDDRFPTVSNNHAVISRDGDTWLLTDLDSANGTFVNGTMEHGEYELQDGDEIRLAGKGPRLRFVSSGS